jgi:serine/threonine protein kinase
LHVPSRLDVYAAVHDFTKTPAHVFLYQKSPWNEDTERFLRHAERRAKALYRCAAPRVIRLYNAQDLPDQLFLAQEAYEGLNLDATVQKRGRLPPKLVRSVLRHLAVTVAGLHDAGVRHLDIRPEYVLVGGHLDAHGGSQHRLTGLTNPMIDDAVVSTVVYNHSYEQSFTAQEMCQSDHSDRGKPQVDIFSLGRLGAFLLLGKDAYRDRVTAQAVDGPDFALPTTDARLVRTLQRAMDRRPAARQSSAADLADELREA